jgi:hypothetical protein
MTPAYTRNTRKGKSRTITRRGQKYEVLGTRPYETRSGYWIDLVEIASHCADCGRRFVFFSTDSRIHKGLLNRRCERHHRVGVPAATTTRWRKTTTRARRTKTARPRRASRSVMRVPDWLR